MRGRVPHAHLAHPALHPRHARVPAVSALPGRPEPQHRPLRQQHLSRRRLTRPRGGHLRQHR
eukprot:3109337-Prorocentrum_lima.AAC.1